MMPTDGIAPPSRGPSSLPAPRSAAAILLLLLTLMTVSLVNMPAGAETVSEDGPSMPLYLVGGSALTPARPAGDTDQVAEFRPGVGISSVDVGIWSSRPVESDLEVEGKVKVSIWARGSGIQSSCFFGVQYGVDGEYIGDTIHTQESALSGTATEFEGEGTTTFNLSKGQTLTVLVRVHERGTGGEIVFGSSAHPSAVRFTATPVMTATYAEEHKAGRNILVLTRVRDAWGVEDIDTVEQFIAGPYETRQIGFDPETVPEEKVVDRAAPSEQATTGVTASDMNVSWSFIYEGYRHDGKEVVPGIYYLVGRVMTKGGEVHVDVGTVVLPEEPPGLFEGPSGAIIGALVIGAFAVGIYLWALRSERIYTPKGKAVATALMVSIVVCAGLYVFVTAVPMSSSGGEDAPDFSLTSIDGKRFSLSENEGKVVLLDLFATWCPACNSEMPTLVKLHKRYKDAVFLSISVEGSGDTDDDIKAFREQYGADWLFLRDTDGVWQKYQDLARPYIPTIVIINPQGKLTFRDIGEIPYKELSEQMDKAMKGGIDIGISTQDSGLVFVAFVTGVLSFFAPCAFPLLPGYMGYVLSRREAPAADVRKGRPSGFDPMASARGGIVAAVGILAVFSLAGILVAAAGTAIVAYVAYLAPVIAVVIAVMGLLMLLDRTAWTGRIMDALTPVTSRVQTGLAGRSTTRATAGSNTGLFLYGAGYGVASMGCQAPVFVALMVAGFMAGGFASAFLVFLVFGIGMGIMMVAVTMAVGMARGVAIQRMTNAMPLIKRVSGLILLVAGVYLAWYYISLLMV